MSNKLQYHVQDTRAKATSWARSLKMGDAALDIITFPFIALSYIVGLLFYVIKYFVGLLIFGFKKGARVEDK